MTIRRDSERGGRDLNPPALSENGALGGIKDLAHTSEVPSFRGVAQGPQRLLAQSSEIGEAIDVIGFDDSGHDARAGGDR